MNTALLKHLLIDDEDFLALVRAHVAMNQIKKIDLAKEIGVTPDVLSKTLNGKIKLKESIKWELVRALAL